MLLLLLLLPSWLQAVMSKVLAGQQLVLRNRPDAAFFAEQEKDALQTVQQLMPRLDGCAFNTHQILLFSQAQFAPLHQQSCTQEPVLSASKCWHMQVD
jgi:hypothetical protein